MKAEYVKALGVTVVVFLIGGALITIAGMLQ